MTCTKSKVMELLPLVSRLWKLGVISSEERTRLANLCRYTCIAPNYLDAVREELECIRKQRNYSKAAADALDECIVATYQ